MELSDLYHLCCHEKQKVKVKGQCHVHGQKRIEISLVVYPQPWEVIICHQEQNPYVYLAYNKQYFEYLFLVLLFWGGGGWEGERVRTGKSGDRVGQRRRC